MLDEGNDINLNIVRIPTTRRKVKEKSTETGVDFHKDFDLPVKTPKKPKISTPNESQSNSIWKKFKETSKSSMPLTSGFIRKKAPKTSSSVTSDPVKPKIKKKISNNNQTVRFDDCDDKPNKRKGPVKITSLFLNNPDIPNVPHRAVKPVKENVFSNSEFKDLEIHPYMVKYLDEQMGLKTMTTVQQKSIPVLLQGNDALVRSQTGSGKTLAFVLPTLHALQNIKPKINRSDGVLVLVVVPSRELALQTYEIFEKLTRCYTWIVPGYLAGGERRKSEKARLRKGISILIGTPGRLIDHVENTKSLHLDKVKYLVLDEADRLLDLGYEKDVATLINKLNENQNSVPLLKPDYLDPGKPKKEEKKVEGKCRQTILLSATLTPGVERLAGLSLKDPVFIDACDESLEPTKSVPVFHSTESNVLDTVVLPESLIQKYVVTPAKLRLVTLASLILWKCKLTENRKMLIFIATQDMVDYHTDLLSTGLSVFAQGDDSDDEDSSSGPDIKFFKLHGSMNQSERTEVFKTFRKSHSGVLLCTDVASRGLDLPEVDWVVQYTGPTSVSDYVHRVGRTARGGQSGSSIIFLTPNEVKFISKLENCRIRLEEEKMDVCLRNLLILNPEMGTFEEAASKLQNIFETVVAEQSKLHDSACKAYSSWSRFYSCYPRIMRDSFNVKTVHQGHYAKSFALREPPSAIINHAKRRNLNNDDRFEKKRVRERPTAEKVKVPKRSKLLDVSEFDSGMEPIIKKRKV